MKKLSVFILALLLSCSTEKKNKTEETLSAYFKESKIPAAIMGSVDPAGNIKFYAYGPATWGENSIVAPDNIFRIYSMTKAIASVGAMQLVEQGKLTLDGPLNSIMPEMAAVPILGDDGKFTPSDEPITLRQLLTHTSGFAYRWMTPKLAAFKPTTWEYADDPRIFLPGKGWKYSTSTDWVGKLIEKVSGKDLETYLRENVTGPLKMNSTWFNVPAELQSKIVSWGGRDSTGVIKEFPRLPKEPATKFSAGGGLFGSPSDYMRFLQCMLNGGELDGVRILKKETVDLMMQDHLPADVRLDIESEKPNPALGDFADNNDRWGLAWALEANPNEKVRPQGVAYWAGAANSFYTLDPKNKIAIVYFTQYFPFMDKVSFDFYRVFEKEVYSTIK